MIVLFPDKAQAKRLSCAFGSSLLDEIQKVLVQAVLVGIGDAMRTTGVLDESGAVHQLCGGATRGFDGAIWASVPWTTNVGTFTRLRSSTKFDSENALMESNLDLWLPCMPWAQKLSIWPAELFAPGRLKPKHGPAATSL
jgi:hypothetical protein